MPQKQTSEEQSNVTWEKSAWVAKDVSLNEPQRYSGPPLKLADDQHVLDVLLDGDSIHRER
jgi:hypothetical protein